MAISFAAGQVLTANELNLLAPQYVVKASDQLVTNSTTLVNDNDIVFTLQANQIYFIEAHLVSQNTTTTGNLRLAWTASGTVAGVNATRPRMVYGSADSGTQPPDAMAIQMRSFAINTNNLNVISSAALDYLIREDLLLTGGTGGGTIQLQFAQFAAVASQSIKLMAGSFAICRCVA